MSPAPNTAPATPATEPVETTLTDDLIVSITTIPEDERDIPEVQFLRAVALEQQKVAIQKQITANRAFLRLMGDTDTLSEELAEWLEVFYPTKEKDAQRSKDEVTETRKNHEAAAKKRKS